MEISRTSKYQKDENDNAIAERVLTDPLRTARPYCESISSIGYPLLVDGSKELLDSFVVVVL